MDKNSKNFVSCIHDEDYLTKFNVNQKNHEVMIYDNGRSKESLNGEWNFSVDPYNNFLRSQWYLEIDISDGGMPLPLDYDFDGWEKIKVPSCWNLQKKEYFWYEGSGLYTRKFDFQKKNGEKVFLKIGAANYYTRVFLNKKYLGWHKGGSTSFYFDITDVVEGTNRLLIVVDNTRREDQVPMDNTDWFNYGGIYRDVELICLPDHHIKDFSLYLIPDGKFNKLMFSLTVSDMETESEVNLKIKNLDLSKTFKVKNGKVFCSIEAKPKLWDIGDPVLYNVEIAYKNDSIIEKIGFREIITKGTDIFLNGRRIFLKGICAHEESVTNGKAVSDDEILENLNLARDLGCNFMRLAHYPHTEKVALYADRMGILLWEEIPVYWGIDFENKNTYDDAENQLMELIKRDHNRASVVIWSVGNENADTNFRLKFMSNLALKAKEIDPSRLVSAACLVDHVNSKINDRLANALDVIGINEYYGWYDPDIDKLKIIFENSKPEKPVVISEFGADAKAGIRGTADDLWSEDKQLALYKKQLDVISSINYIKGITPWILFDFRCPRRNNPFQRFYNRKGLLSEDKKYKKPAYYCLKDFYDKMKLLR